MLEVACKNTAGSPGCNWMVPSLARMFWGTRWEKVLVFRRQKFIYRWGWGLSLEWVKFRFVMIDQGKITCIHCMFEWIVHDKYFKKKIFCKCIWKIIQSWITITFSVLFINDRTSYKFIITVFHVSEREHNTDFYTDISNKQIYEQIKSYPFSYLVKYSRKPEEGPIESFLTGNNRYEKEKRLMS